MKKLIIATGNPGKLKEIQHYLQEFNLEILPQSVLNVSDIEETGQTFIENALLKARHACELTGLPALGDDSGLVIDALGGAPGIYSARYAGENNKSDAANITKVLEQMQTIPEPNRTAHFYCVLVLMRHAADPAPVISIGSWHGSITTAPKGQNGFGYMPIFYVPTHQCTAAELELSVKNQISHRGLALQQLQQQLHELI